ncbi:MAG: hypothetical protein ACRD8Z_26300 [Nitrososphaeraceae archaeon]|jgi:hypothetical protein
MYKLEPKRRTTTTNDVAIVLCILAMYVGITTMGQDEILAQDKSTSITCTGEGPCEKTECINGNCETIATNSSNISSTNGSDDNDSETQESIADSLKDRMRMRED